MQALFGGQSWLIAHSGLQFGGRPRYSGKQVHEGAPLISRHIELSPHGFGMQGFLKGSGILCNGTAIENIH